MKLGYNIETNQEWALKMMWRSKKYKNVKDIAENESAALKEFDHPNIIKLLNYDDKASTLGSSGRKVPIYLFEIEHAPHGELFELIDKTGKFSEKEARFFFTQLISALEYINKKGYWHRDIKLENILLSKEFNVKLADFGFATTNETWNEKRGTYAYMAPEILNGQEYNGKLTDLFSAAIILFIMVVGYPPFTQATEHDKMYNKIITGEIGKFWIIHENRCKSKELNLSESFKDLFISMVLHDPTKRLTMDELKQNEWYTEASAKADDIQDLFNLRYKVLSTNRGTHQNEKSSKESQTTCSSDSKEVDVTPKPKSFQWKGMKLKKYTEYFDAPVEQDLYIILIGFLEENDYTFENKVDEDAIINFIAQEDNCEVKVRTHVVKNPSGNSFSIECTKIEGDKMSFLSVFINLNNYLKSKFPNYS